MIIKIFKKDGTCTTRCWVEAIALIDTELWLYHSTSAEYSQHYNINEIKSYYIEPEDDEQ